MRRAFTFLLILAATTAAAARAEEVTSKGMEEGGVSLVLNFARGPGPGYSDTAVVIPMISLEACKDEGEKVTKKNKKRVNSMYWCVQGTR